METQVKRAIIVAHPDDEVLWTGGIISRYPSDWTIICCSQPQIEPWRSVQFMKVCGILGVKGLILNNNDIGFGIKFSDCFLDELDIRPYDHIITHGSTGEYGHVHHIQIHNTIKKIINKKYLTFFSFDFDNQKKINSSGEHLIELSESEYNKKILALKCYDTLCKSMQQKFKNRNLPFLKRLLAKRQNYLVPQYENFLFKWTELRGLDLSLESYDGDWPF